MPEGYEPEDRRNTAKRGGATAPKTDRKHTP